MADVTIKFIPDADELLNLMDRMQSSIDADGSLQKLVKLAINPFYHSDRIHELITVKSERNPAAAGELFVRFQPTHRFRRIAAAVIAGDVDGLTVIHDRIHNASPGKGM